MIMVEVYVPAYEQTYDMGVDENLSIALVIEEMANVICQRESARLKGKVDELCLCSMESQRILSPERCLRDYRIISGTRLLLI